VTDGRYERLSIAEFADAVGERTPAPASGSTLAVACALAAALAELTARLSEDDPAVAEAGALRVRLLGLADEDAAAYADYMETRSEEAKSRTVDVPLELAHTAASVARLGARLERGASRVVSGDAGAAVELAGAVMRAAARLVEINVGDGVDERRKSARSLVMVGAPPARAVPILPAVDLRETLVFYERLGFENLGAEPEEWNYLIVVRGGIELHFYGAPETDPLTTAASCYIRVDDAQALHDEWRAVGVERDERTGSRLTEPADADYGMREFALVDPSGNLLRIGSPL